VVSSRQCVLVEWWQTLLVASVPVLITSFFLWLQQRSNAKSNERADTQRRLDATAEREHQERLLEIANKHSREQKNEDHRRQSRDAWKEDRRSAHTRLLSRLEEISTIAGSALTRLSIDVALKTPTTDFDYDLPVLPNEFVADVALICSDKSADAARAARNQVTVLGGAMIVVRVAAISMGQSGSVTDRLADAQKALTRLEDTVTEYRQAAKQDIDTID
jgi:hypothetical protein